MKNKTIKLITLICVSLSVFGCSTSKNNTPTSNEDNTSIKDSTDTIQDTSSTSFKKENEYSLSYQIDNSWTYNSQLSGSENKYYYLKDGKSFILIGITNLASENIFEKSMISDSYDSYIEGLKNNNFIIDECKNVTMTSAKLEAREIKTTTKSDSGNIVTMMNCIIVGKDMYNFCLVQQDKFEDWAIDEYKKLLTSIFVLQEDNNTTDFNSNETNYSDDFSLENAVNVTDMDTRSICWVKAKAYVKDNLKSPSSAKFPFTSESDGVSILKDGNYYCVIGWVDAENSFGAEIRSDFVVILKKSNNSYTLYDIAID